MIEFINLFDRAVNKMNISRLANQQEEVFFFNGHPIEIVNRLSQMTTNNTFENKRFPLVALFQDFKTKDLNNGIIEADLNIIIANDTSPDYIATERYTHNFTPVLRPILKQLLIQVGKDKKTATYSLDFDQYDRLFWGKNGLYGNEGNIFNDFIDAIEIKNFNVKIYNNECNK